ncbi:MAG: hypothetical protein NT176_17235 [Proteobacteria bacterium]|nr:hypothetical protein [Pseudomonadota bacterium]
MAVHDDFHAVQLIAPFDCVRHVQRPPGNPEWLSLDPTNPNRNPRFNAACTVFEVCRPPGDPDRKGYGPRSSSELPCHEYTSTTGVHSSWNSCQFAPRRPDGYATWCGIISAERFTQKRLSSASWLV